MLKVIYINLYTLYDKKIPIYDPGTDAFFRFGMGVFIADELLRRNYPVALENWRMDMRITEFMEKVVNGITCKIFPSKKAKWLGEYSAEFFKALKKEAKQKNVVFHFIGVHNRVYHFMAQEIAKNKVISTHIGGANPFWLYQNERNKKAYINYLLEKFYFLKFYDHFISISRAETNYLMMLKKSVSHMPIFGIPMEESLEIRDRLDQRKSLGLPLDKKILLQVGRATRYRGFDWIMNILNDLKDKSEYFFVFAGIDEEDEYHSQLVEGGYHIKSYLNRQELVKYYNAADLLFYLPNGKMDLEFAGTSYVPLEALVCGTPVIATTLDHFPSNEINEVARIPKTKDDIIPMLEEVLSAEIGREKCREIALKHFSWDSIIKKHWEIYNA